MKIFAESLVKPRAWRAAKLWGTYPRAMRALYFMVLIVGGCSSVPEIPAKGYFLGERIETTVDSQIAKYYLESHSQNSSQRHDLDQRIDEIYRDYGLRLPTRGDLKEISKVMSVDFAALFFAEHLSKGRDNKKIQLEFAENLQAARNDLGDIYFQSDAQSPPYVVLFVPGWNYIEVGHLTGANLANPRAIATRLGIENYLVGINATGSVEENADTIAHEIIRHAEGGRPIILVGPSSAGPAIHLALGNQLGTQHLQRVKAWLNLGGILQGSPLIDYWQPWPRNWLFQFILWYKEWNREHVLSMSAEHSRRRFALLDLPDDLLVVNYLGIPLSGDLSQNSRDKYPMLRKDGPNDGLTLLADVIAPGSVTIVALGSDHFFAEDPEIDLKTVALAKTMMQRLESQ